MPCYHPMKGFVIGRTDTGKKDMIIAPYDTECVFLPAGSSIWEKHGYVLDSNIVQGRVVDYFVPIPCGQCVGCRLEYSRQWAIRCMLESEYHKENYFITITYDPEHVPRSEYIDKDTGAYEESLTLDKSDLQLFIKRLRSALVQKKKNLIKQGVQVDWDPKFRFYSCGEYGSRTARPHYHMIAFGLHLDDLVYDKSTPTGDLYTSKFLDKHWKKGKIWVGTVTFESCAYVSRYIMKKQKGKGSSVYGDYNIVPDFVNMSRKPGIGWKYFSENYKDIYDIDTIVLSGGRISRPPNYFDRLMDEVDEELMINIKDSRIDIAESIQEYKKSLSSDDYQGQLAAAERNKESSVKRLVRSYD